MMENYALGWSGIEYLFPVWFPLVILLIAGIRQIRKRYFYESYCLFEKKHPVIWRLIKVIAIGCVIVVGLVIFAFFSSLSMDQR